MFSVSTLRKFAIIGGGFFVLLMLHLQTSNTYRYVTCVDIYFWIYSYLLLSMVTLDVFSRTFSPYSFSPFTVRGSYHDLIIAYHSKVRLLN